MPSPEVEELFDVLRGIYDLPERRRRDVVSAITDAAALALSDLQPAANQEYDPELTRTRRSPVAFDNTLDREETPQDDPVRLLLELVGRESDEGMIPQDELLLRLPLWLQNSRYMRQYLRGDRPAPPEGDPERYEHYNAVCQGYLLEVVARHIPYEALAAPQPPAHTRGPVDDIPPPPHPTLWEHLDES
jgi:hypothetical protein